MSQYFDTPSGKSNVQKKVVNLIDLNLEFFTDHGTFSKSGIDEGSAFLIKTISEKIELGGECLDLGCGWGAIAIFLAKKFAKTNFTAVDINERAVKLTEENAKLNKLKVSTKVSNIFENISENKFDFIITNPPFRAGNQVLFKMFDESFVHLNKGGKFVVVLRVKQGGKTYFARIQNIFGNGEILDKHKGYLVAEFTKN